MKSQPAASMLLHPPTARKTRKSFLRRFCALRCSTRGHHRQRGGLRIHPSWKSPGCLSYFLCSLLSPALMIWDLRRFKNPVLTVLTGFIRFFRHVPWLLRLLSRGYTPMSCNETYALQGCLLRPSGCMGM